MLPKGVAELFDRLVEMLTYLNANPSGFQRGDLDEIVMLAEACKEQLPDRLNKVIEEFDEHFSVSGFDKRAEFLDRALRIIKVSGSIPTQSVSTDPGGLLPTFELEKKDKERVLKLCEDMRKIIFASPDFDEPHKKRLLNRVAAIEKQVLSPKGIFDVVLGGVSDVGETLGKFGKDVKPLTDRMDEIAKITRKGTKEYDQIPAPDEVKKLPSPRDTQEEN